MKKAILALAIVTLLVGNGVALATDKWLDTNGTAGADSGIANASTIVWATGTTNWNTASSGSGGAISGWTSGTGDRAFLAAGADTVGRTYTLNVTSALTAGSVFVEEGTITKSGAVLTVNQIDIASGASFVYANSGGIVPTGTSPAVTLHGTGATFGYTAGGGGGTFLNTGMKIVLDGGGTLTDAVGNPNIYSGVISGTGDLVKTGAGILAITTTATYTGSTIVNAGTLRLRTGTPQIPNTDLIVNGTGGFDGATFAQTVQSLSGNGKLPYSGSGTLTIAGTASTIFSGVTSGSGRINVNKSGGTGTLSLTGVNLSTGRFTLTNGNVDVAAAASIGGDVMDLHVEGGTLTLNQAAESVENLVGAAGSIVLNNAALSLVVDPAATGISNSSVISGPGGLTKVNVISGATVRTQTLAGNNTYNGNTFVKGGILSVQHANALGSTTGYTEVNQVGAVAAELLFTTVAGSVTTSEPLRISGAGSTNNGVIAVTAGATPTISGPVTLIGNSTLTVSGTSSVTYNNATAITSLANQNLTLQGGAGTSPLGIGTISGVIALGTGGLTKAQGGTWVLSSATGNIYSGGTTINGGTLKANNTPGTSATGSGAVTINNGGTLAGTGAVSGPVTVNGGGTLAPGTSIESLDVGALSFNTDVVNGGSKLAYEINSSVALNMAADLVNVTGNLSIATGALLAISDAANVFLTPGTKFTLISYSGMWNSGTFATHPDDSLLTVGANLYVMDYNDQTGGSNFGGGPLSLNYVTITAVVPEPSAFLFGSLFCAVVGLAYGGQKMFRRRAAV